MKKENKKAKKRGISEEVNWEVFRSTLALYVSSAWLFTIGL